MSAATIVTSEIPGLCSIVEQNSVSLQINLNVLNLAFTFHNFYIPVNNTLGICSKCNINHVNDARENIHFFLH